MTLVIFYLFKKITVDVFLILELPDRPRNVTMANRGPQASFYGVGRHLTPLHHEFRGKNL